MVQADCLKNKILVICGPTASGKTALAAELAKRLHSEVISADSMYIYKGFDIGTAKPTEEEMQGVKHDMIAKDEKIRKKYENLVKERGNDYVFSVLREVDPKTAEKLHKNDTKRVIRALEIYEISGKAKSSYKDEVTPVYDYLAISYDYPREILYDRINRRVDKMFEKGLTEEVEKLLKKTDRNCQAMQAIGYKETLDYIDGKTDLAETKELIRMNSRRYAKRQITFFKKLAGLKFIQPENIDADAQKVLSLL